MNQHSNKFISENKETIEFVRVRLHEQLGHQYHHYDVAPGPRATEGLSHLFPT